ncbi:MAG: hypothetical protein WCT39_03555 [Candidatus Margulisiibacteriota bacterium]
MTLLVTRPQHDDATAYLSAWAEEVISTAKQRGIEVTDLRDTNANKTCLGQAIEENAPRLVFLNGHGGADCVFGHENNILIKVEDNHDLLAGKITYALACNAGQELGPRISETADSAFIGYSDKFIFPYSRSHVATPQNDPVARPFMAASNKVMISLLEGRRAQEASDLSKNSFLEEYNNYLSSDAGAAEAQIAQCLWWNMSKQVCLGEGDARLTPN